MSEYKVGDKIIYSDDEHRTCDRGTFACPIVGEHEMCETF